MSKPTVHMIGQAHLDPVWLWRWTEGRAEALATSQSAVDRLREYPDFHFTRGEAQIYAWIEEENPALFAAIREYIQTGRWHVVNGMVIQPDMNLPQGESFVRQILLGKRYMREHLGVEPRIAYCVDSFGHAGTLPQILSKCGFDAYVFMRPGAHEKTLPAQTFWWQAPDGSRILTFRIAFNYETRVVEHQAHIERTLAAKPAALNDVMCFFGVGNHGGGPTKAQIENVQQLTGERKDLNIVFSWPDAYFAAVAGDIAGLPTVAEELQFHAIGCYSVNSALKRSHRKAECGLLFAERMAVLAEQWVGRPAPLERLRALWWELCFNQFHDTLGGSSVKEAEDDAVRALDGICATAERIANDACRVVGAHVNTSGPGAAILLFNPSGQKATGYVEYEPWTEWESWEALGYSLVDAQGEAVPYQFIDTHEALTRPAHGIVRLVFRAAVPAMGYRTYRFASGLPAAAPLPNLAATPTMLDNGHIQLRLDEHTGAIVSCLDKMTGTEFVGPRGWNVAQVLEDTSDTWSHRIPGFAGPVLGEFRLVESKVADLGPLQASIIVERAFGASRWTQQIVVRRESDAILIRNWIYWDGQWQTVKLAFDVNTSAPEATHDVAFGHCVRPCDGAEVPTQMWMDVSGPLTGDSAKQIGAALLNDGKYGCDVNGSVMRLTILRSPPYAYHEPHQFGIKARYDWVDQGYQEFLLELRPHLGDWRDAGVVEAARALNMPMLPITMHAHSGVLPTQSSLLGVTGDDLEVTALKPAEDGDGVVLRLADRHGRGASGTVNWMGAAFEVILQPSEVATYRINRINGEWRLTGTDMLERPN